MFYDPFILRYRDDPRFAACCRKVGLPVPGEMSPPATPVAVAGNPSSRPRGD